MKNVVKTLIEITHKNKRIIRRVIIGFTISLGLFLFVAITVKIIDWLFSFSTGIFALNYIEAPDVLGFFGSVIFGGGALSFTIYTYVRTNVRSLKIRVCSYARSNNMLQRNRNNENSSTIDDVLFNYLEFTFLSCEIENNRDIAVPLAEIYMNVLFDRKFVLEIPMTAYVVKDDGSENIIDTPEKFNVQRIKRFRVDISPHEICSLEFRKEDFLKVVPTRSNVLSYCWYIRQIEDSIAFSALMKYLDDKSSLSVSEAHRDTNDDRLGFQIVLVDNMGKRYKVKSD